MNLKILNLVALLLLSLASGRAAGLFAGKSGTYVGVATYASLQIRVTEAGAYSGTLQFPYRTFRLAGSFHSDGDTGVLNLRSEDETVRFRMFLNGETIAGLLDLGYAIYSRRCPFNARTNPASAYAGSYTVIIGGNDNDSSLPKGDGFATLKIGLDNDSFLRDSKLRLPSQDFATMRLPTHRAASCN
jgi:hypothetical protein